MLSEGLEPGQGRSGRRSRRGIHRRRRRVWPVVVVALLVLTAGLAAGALYVRAEGLPTTIRERPELQTAVQVPGPPRPAWPAGGQAAIAVTGVGGYSDLGTSGAQKPVPIASVAKVMTAYVVLRDFPIAASGPGFTLTVTPLEVQQTDERADKAESVVAVTAGEQLDEYQLLQGMLLASANNMAQILADHDGGTAAFLAKMNSQARQLGMTATTYTDPSGFDPGTVSTAADQVKLAEAAMAVPALAAVVGQPSAVLPGAGTIHNFNHLLGTDGFIGIKTGSDSAAGGALMFADRRAVDGRSVTLYGAILGQDVGQNQTSVVLGGVEGAARKLADSAFSGLGVRTVLPAGSAVLAVSNAEGKTVTGVTVKALTFFGWGGDTFHPSLTLVPLGSKVSVGQAVGTVELGSATGGWGAGLAEPAGDGSSSEVVTGSGLPPVSLSWRLHHAL